MVDDKRFIWDNRTKFGTVIDTVTGKHLSHSACMDKLNELNDCLIDLDNKCNMLLIDLKLTNKKAYKIAKNYLGDLIE